MGSGVDSGALERWEKSAFRRVKIVFSVFACVVFATTAMFAYMQIRDGYTTLLESEGQESRNLARSGTSHATQLFNEAQRILEGIANLYVDRSEWQDFDEAFFHDLLKTSVASSGYIDALYLLDQEGRALSSGNTFPLDQTSKQFSVLGPMGISLEEAEFHLGAFNRSSERSGARIGGRWFVPIIFPIEDASGERCGYVLGVIDPTVFEAFYSDMEVGEHGMVLLWDDRGTLIAGNQNTRWRTGEQVPSIADRMANASARNPDEFATTYVSEFDDNAVVTSLLHMKDFGLWFSVALDGRDFLAQWRENRVGIILEAALFLLFLTALSIVFFNQLRRIEASERKLIDAKNEAEQANKVKVQFLAQVSHEFRTPLNAIIGFSQAIRDRVFGADQNQKYSEYADDIFNSGQHLLDLVNDIIEVSRIEAGEYKVTTTRIDLRLCIQKIVTMLSGLAREQDVTISTTFDDPSVHLQADERLLKQVLINLLSNAIKFSEAGTKVEIKVQSHDASQGNGPLQIMVSDHGKGIEDNILRRIGEPFLIESSQINMEGQGSGLGLSITKTCMELMGGTLKVASVVGEGTQAHLVFPYTVVVNKT